MNPDSDNAKGIPLGLTTASQISQNHFFCNSNTFGSVKALRGRGMPHAFKKRSIMKKYYLITRTLFILSLCGYALSGRSQTQLGADITGAANRDEAGRVSISANGKIVAIGAPFHDETGKENAGHVRIYEYKTNTSGSSGWTQLLGGGDLNGEAANDQSGYSVSLSADGKTVAIGAPYNDAGGSNAGHVRVYKYNGTVWTQLGGDINGAAANDESGHSVSLSADGTIVAIGAPKHDETGKNNAGHVRIYKYTPPSGTTGTGTTGTGTTASGGTGWTQLGEDLNGDASRDESGYSVSLSADGKIVAIGAPKHNGDGPLHTKEDIGQVRIYEYTAPSSGTGTGTTGTGTTASGGTGWKPLGEEIEGKARNDWSGWSVSLSSDGKTVAIGATRQEAGGNAPSSVRVYEYKTDASGTGSEWKQAGTDINQGEGTFDIATGEGENKGNKFGWSVSLSGDGKTVAIGEPGKGGNPSVTPRTGRARIYKRDAATTVGWKQLGTDITGEVRNGELGTSVSLSADGTTVAVGAKGVHFPYGSTPGTPGLVQVHEFFLITSPSTASVAESTTGTGATTAAYTITSNKTAATFALGTAKDEGLFNLVGSEVSFKTPPDFENPTDGNTADGTRDNVYEIQITATSGGESITKDVTITVTNVVEVPVFSSEATASVLENTLTTTTVYTAAVSDASTKDAVTFSLETPAGGTGDEDNAKFTIDGSTGAVKFRAVPDFEAPADANTDNVYNIQITATAGSGTNKQTTTKGVTITVTDIPDENPPVITSGATASVAENTTGTVYTATATDDATAATAITFSLAAGVKDNDLFEITPAGLLTFRAAPDYENPAGINKNAATDAAKNVYEIQITARDEVGNNSAPKAVTITVTNVVEAPVFTSAATKEVAENTTGTGTTATGYTAAATADASATTGLSFSLAAGVKDNGLFDINASTGVVTFRAAPDFENPVGINKNAATDAAKNVYEVQITASTTAGAGTGGTQTSTHDVTITVTNVVEVPVFGSENTAQTLENATGTVYRAVATPSVSTSTVAFSLKAPSADPSVSADDDNDKFKIDGTSGEIKFKAAHVPDYENPGSAAGSNVYNIQITATAGGESVTKDVAITVNNQVEAPVFTSAATKEVPEKITGTVYTATTGTDTDAPTFSLKNPADARTADDDNAKFTIDGTTGAVSFKAAHLPDFENPGSAAGSNVYNIQITATAGGDNIIKNVTITVTNVVEAPVFSSGATASVAENTPVATVIYTAAVSDASTKDKVTFSLAASTTNDNAKFTIDGTSGAIKFREVPDFENPGSASGDNVYNVQITATAGSDATAQTATHNVTITVTNEVETPVFSSVATVSVAENTPTTTTVYTAAVSDASKKDAVTFSLASSTTNDNARFTIDATTGAVKFKAAPDYENPSDTNTDNVYNIQITATVPLSAAQAGSTAQTATHNVTITVTDIAVENPPEITSGATASVAENSTAVVYTATATDDVSAAADITFSLASGVKDNDLFAITSAGLLTFKTAPDFESPADADGKNDYELEITARDEVGNAITKAVTITVTNVVEAPVFSSGAAASVAENTPVATVIYTAAVSDASSKDEVTFSLASSTTNDNAKFTIDGTSGEIKFVAVPDFENPADKDGKNDYNVQITATAGLGTSAKTVTKDVVITVTDVAEQATIVLLPEALTFADTKVGETVSKALTISNPSAVALNVTAITLPTGFTGDWTSGEIAAGGGEQVVNVSFKPTEVKDYAGTITVTSDGSGRNTLTVSGKGILVTAIEPQSIFPGLSVFPNPAEDVLNIKLPNQNGSFSLQLVDVNGQVVYEQEAITTNELSLDVSGYKSGVYVLVLESGGKVEKRKVVIQ